MKAPAVECTDPSYFYEEEGCRSLRTVLHRARSGLYGKQHARSRSRGYDVYDSNDACAKSTLCPGVYYGYEPAYNNEKYNTVSENAFMNAVSSPLSTFGADVDTASYSNLRRMINDGYGLYDIPSGSIRTEELINYFNYDYKAPKRGETFAVNAQIIDCPWK